MTDSIVVEQSGVCFETLVPEHIWPIPENQLGTETSVRFGIRITNQTRTPLRFCSYWTLFPILIEPNGKHLLFWQASDASRSIGESDCPLVESKENVTFFLNGHLAWNNSKLYLKGYVQSGGVWGFRDDIKPGKYSFYFKYSNLNQERRIYHQEMKKMKILDNIWTGQVETPLTKISLVLPY